MSGLSDEDRETFAVAMRTCRLDAVIEAVEAIVARHVTAALTEAADAIQANAADFCEGCDSCDGNTRFGHSLAAAIVRDRIPQAPATPPPLRE